MLASSTAAHAQWWRPNGGGGRQQGSSGGEPRPYRPQASAPADCRWVTVSKQAQYTDPSGRTVYQITQKNTCTGEVRTIYGY